LVTRINPSSHPSPSTTRLPYSSSHPARTSVDGELLHAIEMPKINILRGRMAATILIFLSGMRRQQAMGYGHRTRAWDAENLPPPTPLFLSASASATQASTVVRFTRPILSRGSHSSLTAGIKQPPHLQAHYFPIIW
jgi:hypothetical protein